MTEVFMVEMPRPISLSGRAPRPVHAKNPARRSGAPDKSNQLSRLVARARGRCLAANSGVTPAIAALSYEIRRRRRESGEMMIPPLSPGESELVHMAARKKIRRAVGRAGSFQLYATTLPEPVPMESERALDS